VDLPADDKFDGVNLLPHLTGSAETVERDIVFWQLNLYKSLQRHSKKPTPYATEIARKGKWKMLAKDGEPVELFDIEADIYEKNNLMDENPDVIAELKKDLKGWLAEPREQFGNISN